MGKLYIHEGGHGEADKWTSTPSFYKPETVLKNKVYLKDNKYDSLLKNLHFSTMELPYSCSSYVHCSLPAHLQISHDS